MSLAPETVAAVPPPVLALSVPSSDQATFLLNVAPADRFIVPL